MTIGLDQLSEQTRLAVAETGQKINELLDAVFPERVAAREAAARQGYQGQRCGWYPHRPSQRVSSAPR